MKVCHQVLQIQTLFLTKKLSFFTPVFRPGLKDPYPISELASKIISSSLRLEPQQKRFLKIHLYLAYFSFFLIGWNWNDKYVHIFPQFPWKPTRFQTKMGNDGGFKRRTLHVTNLISSAHLLWFDVWTGPFWTIIGVSIFSFLGLKHKRFQAIFDFKTKHEAVKCVSPAQGCGQPQSDKQGHQNQSSTTTKDFEIYQSAWPLKKNCVEWDSFLNFTLYVSGISGSMMSLKWWY